MFHICLRVTLLDYSSSMAETLLKESGCAMLGAGMTESDSLADLDRYYDTFARLADRLCVNIASMCFPLTRR